MSKPEERGFIKHDGKGMPDCYDNYDMVDFAYIPSGRRAYKIVVFQALELDASWIRTAHNGYHRRHISERQQLDMAIEALHSVTEALNGRVHSTPALVALRSCDKTLAILTHRKEGEV